MAAKVSLNQLSGIISNIKSKLIDIVLELEKDFDDLDSLDISTQLDKIDKTQLTININNIVFDESIKIGDKNKVKKSPIGNLFGMGKK
jgi:hypothetical protein